MASERSAWRVYLESSIVGAIRGLVTLPLEHPFDMIKTRMQSQNNTNTSFFGTARQIQRDFGIVKGYYAGILPNSIRVMIKSLYRWPMMIAFPRYFSQILPTPIIDRFEAAHRVSAGLAIAVCESFIICPLERLKVYLMTKPANQTTMISHFFQVKNMRELFTGLQAVLAKQIVSWVSFLYIDFKVKQAVKAYYDQQILSNTSLLACALVTGILNTLCTHPIDKAKTLYQMQENRMYKSNSMGQIFRQMVSTEGISNLYVGWQPRMAQYTIQAVFTCSLLEKFEQKLYLTTKGLSSH